MDRSLHLILLSMKRWLLVDRNVKQPGFYVEPQIGSPQAAGRRTKRKRGKPFDFPLFVGVRWARLELAQDYSHYPLKVACLPFHHHRFFCFGIAKVRQKFKPANFFATFL